VGLTWGSRAGPALDSARDSGRIAAVMLRRVLIVALLVYVTLDLSIPAMPGAFGFDPDDSVESVYQTRARAAAEAAIPPASGAAVFVLSEVPPNTGRRPAPVGPARERSRSSRRSSASDEPPPPSEDPH
jgi:hypothetical protein